MNHLPRIADSADVGELQRIERAADRQFDSFMNTSSWPEPPTGASRLESGEFVVVVGEPVAGFAHITKIDGHFHLEQVAVQPDAQRQGIGGALVYAAAEEVAGRGGDYLTLTTFADVPWNRPYYERLGFAVIDPPDYLHDVVERERSIGLTNGGARVVMGRAVCPTDEPRPAVSVIPFRQGEAGLEVYVQHRVDTMDFAPGMVVFPGGRIDPIDEEVATRLVVDDERSLLDAWRDSHYVGTVADKALGARTLLATAVREMREETGVEVRPDELIPWDDWTTPPTFPKRFQAHFMAVHLPSTDPRSPANTTTEAWASEWLPVTEILSRSVGGDLQLMKPTRVILKELDDYGRADVVAAAHPQPVPVQLDRSGRRPRPRRDKLGG